MEKQFDYVIKLDIKFEHLQRIDIPKMIKEGLFLPNHIL
jgi:hypothetical protein